MTRPEEIKLQYIKSIDQHLDDLVLNKAEKIFKIEDFANLVFIHPTHLSNTIKDTTNISACGIFQIKIVERALRLLADHSLSITEIVSLLTYDPSQSTKWFKRVANLTPKKYHFRLSSANKTDVNSEMVTTSKKYANTALSF